MSEAKVLFDLTEEFKKLSVNEIVKTGVSQEDAQKLVEENADIGALLDKAMPLAQAIVVGNKIREGLDNIAKEIREKHVG